MVGPVTCMVCVGNLALPDVLPVCRSIKWLVALYIPGMSIVVATAPPYSYCADKCEKEYSAGRIQVRLVSPTSAEIKQPSGEDQLRSYTTGSSTLYVTILRRDRSG